MTAKVPFQDFLLPVLTLASREEQVSQKSIKKPLLDFMRLPDGFERELLPKGGTVLSSRISWAFTWLYHSGLLKRVALGNYSVTAEGLRVLSLGLERLDRKFLMQYPGFRKAWTKIDTSDGPARRGRPAGNAPPAGPPPPSEPGPRTQPRAATLSRPPKPTGEKVPKTPSPHGPGGQDGARPVSSTELLLPVLKAAEDLRGREAANIKALIPPAMAYLAEHRAKTGGPPPGTADPADPELIERVRSACFRLESAGLMRKKAASPMDRVTDDGRALLAENRESIDYQVLKRYPAYNWAMARGEARQILADAEADSRDRTVSEMAGLVLGLGREGFRRLGREIARVSGPGAGGPPFGSREMPSFTIDAEDGAAAAASLATFASEMGEDRAWVLLARGDFPRDTDRLLLRLTPRVKATNARAIAAIMHDLGLGVTGPPALDGLSVLELNKLSPGFFKNLGS
ncbi:MAG: winged helix-turn-helix domain-containing protein [Deltaproteobacteria bacterium]|jgi:restriction endonuclease Mrr|nr:winged helix-turn-helix domain-containing protein [Deltaproteobacteria bacterium]